MKFSGYLPVHEDTSATDFGPDRSIRLAGHGPKVGHNVLHCAGEYKCDRNFQGVMSVFNLFNNLVLGVPKMEQTSKSGTVLKSKIVLVTRFSFCYPYIRKKNIIVTNFLK